MGIKAKPASGCLVALLALSLSACGSSYPDIKSSSKKPRSKEYFAESEYGVKASPRMAVSSYDTTTKSVALVPIPKPIGATTAGQAYALSAPAKSLRRGGGRMSIGKPYKIRGKWYKPADQPGYSREGKASWYGDAFHGRLTANGEIYDMNNLTAAHPTLPLPSYARVTNVANGTSVVVRINDRGPYAEGRVIDLSKRVAQVLDTKHAGIGRVQVDYIGIAPVNGQDDAFLLASFRQNSTGNLQEDMAMYAAFTSGAAPAQPVMIASSQANEPVQAFAPMVQPVVFDQLPAPASRPMIGDGIGMVTSPFGRRSPSVPLGYQISSDIQPDRFGVILEDTSIKSTKSNQWKTKSEYTLNTSAPIELLVGTFSAAEMTAFTAQFGKLGKIAYSDENDGLRVTLTLDANKADQALNVLWAAGYSDAFSLR